MDIIKTRARLQKLIDSKETNRSMVSRQTGLGYITIINVLDIDYPFEVKASTLRKINQCLDKVEKKQLKDAVKAYKELEYVTE